MSSDASAAQPLTLLGGISAEQFLREYWQKKPLLIRQAMPGFQCPIDGNELAGLAMEEEVESRLIIEKQNWALKHGPFSEKDFNKLPNTHWTLLVQQLDAWMPEINALKSQFNFIPNWRIDDVMASYAPEGGSVGPHFDDYDVFLLQAHGQRHWRTGQKCDDCTPLQPHPKLKLLAEFHPDQTWVLEPGDMLYLPPKIAHYGIAQNDCITLSIGFRAPSIGELADRFASHLASTMMQPQRYQDPDLFPQIASGEISAEAISRVQELLRQAINDRESVTQWFGELVTEPKNPSILQAPEQQLDRAMVEHIWQKNWRLQTNEGSRFAYTAEPSGINIFVDGQQIILGELTELDYICALEFAQNLCRIDSLPARDLIGCNQNPALMDAVHQLLNTGSLYCPELDAE